MRFFLIILVVNLAIYNPLLAKFRIDDSTKPSPFIPYCYMQESRLDTPIHLEWVQLDRNLIKNIVNKLPANGSTIHEIQKLIPHFLDGKCNCQSKTQDLGYGLKSTLYEMYGGYGTYYIDAIYFGDRVLKLRLGTSNHLEILEKYLLDDFALPFECLNGHLCYEKVYSDNLKKYLNDSGQLFLASADTNFRRRQAINYFTDVLTGGIFVEPFYIREGLGKETFDNLRYFIANLDYSALESILFSPSPTSRIFAARTLIYMSDKYGHRLNTKVAQRISEIMADIQLIRSGVLSCHVGRYKYDYYDIVKDFEQLLVTQ